MINIKTFIHWYGNKYGNLVKEFDNYGIYKIYLIKKDIILFGSSLIKFDDNGDVIGYIETFNLQDPIEKQLARIYSFYEVLNGVGNPVGEILYGTLNSEEKLFDYFGGQEIGDYNVNNYDSYIGEDGMEKCFPSKKGIWIGCDEENNIPYTEFYLTYKEFYILMQIYFGLYEEKELKNKLEEKEKRGEYEEMKKILNNDGWENKYKGIDGYRNFVKYYLSQAKVQEYLKLELMRKDTSGVFAELNIKKIYDKDWSEEKQKKCVEEVNKEFGEEVIVEDR